MKGFKLFIFVFSFIVLVGCGSSSLGSDAAITTSSGYQPKYFAFGDPNEETVTNYKELNKNVFFAKDEEGKKAICIVYKGKVECFFSGMGNTEKNIELFKATLPNATCEEKSSYTVCESGEYACYYSIGGSLSCVVGNEGCMNEGGWALNCSTGN